MLMRFIGGREIGMARFGVATFLNFGRNLMKSWMLFDGNRLITEFIKLNNLGKN